MNRSAKRVGFWILAPLLLFLFLLIVLYAVAIRIINQESVKNRVESAVSGKLGGRFSYKEASIALLSRPRFVIRDLNISVPGKISVNMKSLDIYPEMAPLFTGKLRLAKVLLDAPDV